MVTPADTWTTINVFAAAFGIIVWSINGESIPDAYVKYDQQC